MSRSPRRLKRKMIWQTLAEFEASGGNSGFALDFKARGWEVAGRLVITVYTDNFVELQIPLRSPTDRAIRGVWKSSYQGKKGEGE